MSSTIEGVGGTKQRIQGIGGGFDILTPNPSNFASLDVYYPSSMTNTQWRMQRVVTSVEGDAGQAATVWTLLGGSNGERAINEKLTEVYNVYFVAPPQYDVDDALYQYDGKTVRAAVLDRASTLASRLGVESDNVHWAMDSHEPQQITSYTRNKKDAAVELSTLQRKIELSEIGFGSDELIKLTTCSFGAGIDRVCRIKTRYKRGYDELTGKRIVDGIEIVTTYRVLDGVAGIEMPTSTCKSRLRLTEL
jgi:hypothetical protein